MDKLSTWISILIFIIIPLLSQFLNKKRIVEEKKENSKKNPTELYPETDDDWYEDHAHTVVSNKKVVKDDYSEIKKQTEENHKKKKIKTMNKNIDSEALGIGHDHLFDNQDEMKKAIIISEILKTKF